MSTDFTRPVPPLAAPLQPLAPEKGSEGTILIVDDEELNLDMLSRRLRRSGYTVEVANSGRAALAAVEKQSFDLVLLDQMMPGLSGAEVLEIWRARWTPQELPVVMVTAVAESDRIAAALGAGANDYITKPIDFQVALARIRAQLARARAEHRLRQSEERYALAARASRDGLWDWNLVTDEVYYSPRWLEMLGIEHAEATPETWLARVLPSDRAATHDALQAVRRSESEMLQCSYRVLTATGALRWMSCRAVVTRGGDGSPVRLAGSQSDVTEEKTRDPLTGLSNRLYLLGHLERAAHKENTAAYAVLLLDLDKFKTINDSLGHLAGDDLLRQIAGRLRAVVREEASTPLQPICSRLGGDEFAILLQEHATRDKVAQFVQRLQASMEPVFAVAKRDLYCSWSVGVACACEASHGENTERLLEDADAALYDAKARGRAGVVFYEPGLARLAVDRFELENDMRGALERREFVIFYQAKADLSSGFTFGVEALVRWQHPKRGLLPPNSFIPIAEENGLIVDLGRWVLEESCRQVGAWHRALPADPQLQLSVNLSPREFKQPNLVENTAAILAATGFPPSALHLEVTENVLIEELDVARRTLAALKGLGVQLELDDFGSGYSSLKYLRELPFDCLKIDRYFTLDISPDKPAAGRLVKAIVSMAESLGMSVIAEGVESQPHSAALQELGCKLGQGYLFSRPIEAASMMLLLEGQRAVQEQRSPGA